MGYVADKFGSKPTLLFALVLASVEVVLLTLLPKYEAAARFKIGVDTRPEDISASSLVIFGEYFSTNQSCQETLDFTIEEISCEGEGLSKNFTVKIEHMLNTSGGQCDATSMDFCIYKLAEYDEGKVLFCDVILKDEKSSDEEGNRTLLFWLYLVLRFFWAFSISPGWIILDAIAITVSKRADIEFGYIYFLGNLSGMLSPLLVGYLINSISFLAPPIDCITGSVGQTTYQMPFYTGTLITLAGALYVSRVQFTVDLEKKKGFSFKDDFAWLLKPAAFGYFLIILADGIIFGVFGSFFAFYLVDELNISQKWFGILSSTAMAINSFYTLVSGAISKHVGSMNLILLGGVMNSAKIVITSAQTRYEDDQVPYQIIFSLFLGINQHS